MSLTHQTATKGPAHQKATQQLLCNPLLGCFPYAQAAKQKLGVADVQSAMIPIPLPGVSRTMYPLAPEVSPKDEKAVANVTKIADFLLGGQAQRLAGSADPLEGVRLAQELAPFLPAVASEILPQVRVHVQARQVQGCALWRSVF